MKRRGFLAALGLGGGAIASGMALGAVDESKGIYVTLKCHTENCAGPWSVFVDLTKPIMQSSPQCPRCLMVMAYPDDCAQNIKAWNIMHGHKTTIYTPRRI